MAFAPRPVSRRLHKSLGLLVLLALLAATGVAVWYRLRPPPDLTLTSLQGAYAGTVGTNDITTTGPSTSTDPPLRFSPAACAPLFGATVANQWPSGGLDGVSTYWPNDGTASVSLSTVRYPDDRAASAAYGRLTAALPGCQQHGGEVTFTAPATLDRRLPTSGGMLHPIPLTTTDKTPDQVAYRLERVGRQGRYVVHVLRFGNTVSWQYRYDYDTAPYDNTADSQLMGRLITELIRVQAAGRS